MSQINIHDLAVNGKKKEIEEELQRRPNRLEEKDEVSQLAQKTAFDAYTFVLYPSLLLLESNEDIFDILTINLENCRSNIALTYSTSISIPHDQRIFRWKQNRIELNRMNELFHFCVVFTCNKHSRFVTTSFENRTISKINNRVHFYFYFHFHFHAESFSTFSNGNDIEE